MAMTKTGISWTDFSWNPVAGCEKVSPGCKYCYAETVAERFRGGRAFPNGFDLTIRKGKLREPGEIKEPSKIFVNSMSDFFWPKIPDSFRGEMLDVIRANPRHIFQVLTKRPQKLFSFSCKYELPQNFWAGVSVESGKYLDRIEFLKQCRVKIKFVSAEPLLDPLIHLNTHGLDWVIVGGESGGHLFRPEVRSQRSLAEKKVSSKWSPRPDREPWVRAIRDKCRASDTAFFFKQWGGVKPTSAGNLLDGEQYLEFPKY